MKEHRRAQAPQPPQPPHHDLLCIRLHGDVCPHKEDVIHLVLSPLRLRPPRACRWHTRMCSSVAGGTDRCTGGSHSSSTRDALERRG